MQLTIFFSFSWPPKSFFRKSFTLIFIVVNYIWLICFWVEISVAADVSTFFLFCPPLPPPDCLLPIKKASRQQGTRGSRYHPNWFNNEPTHSRYEAFCLYTRFRLSEEVPVYLLSSEGIQHTAPGGTSKDPFIPAFTIPARFESESQSTFPCHCVGVISLCWIIFYCPILDLSMVAKEFFYPIFKRITASARINRLRPM